MNGIFTTDQIESILKHREKDDDTIVLDETIIHDDDFSMLVETSITSNIQNKTIYMMCDDVTNILSKVNNHVDITLGTVILSDSPFVIIRCEKKPRK